MATAINLKAQTRITKTSTIKVTMINKTTNTAANLKSTDTREMVATMTNLATTTPTLVTLTNKTADTTKANTSKAIKMSTTMISTTTKGRQPLASRVKAGMEPSPNVVATIPKKTPRPSATSP